jgi:chromosome segregation ATPase
LEEVEEKSKELIQYFSAHQLFAVEVGTPTPLKEKLENKDMITEIEHRDANHDMDVYTDLVRDQTAKEKQQIEEIKRKTEELKADVQKGPDDKEPLQRYLELVQKRATAAYVYTQHREKLAEYKTVVLATREQIAEMDRQYPNLKDEYLDHYTKTCRETGIDQAVDNMAVMIKQYYAEDPDLGF